MRFTATRGIVCALLAVVVIFSLSRTMSRFSPIPDKVSEAFTEWKNCMTKQFDSLKDNPQKLWEGFAEMTKECTSSTEVDRIKLIELPNDDEVKHYILSQDTSEPSVIVSLGIGADIRVEQQLRKLLPEDTEFFGADPVVAPNSNLYGRLGTFFPVAVSDHSGQSSANIRLDNGEE
ncbi:hypothetical protein COOONC_13080, partial [Cooperia oncophora]